jgi:hypothetical protein
LQSPPIYALAKISFGLPHQDRTFIESLRSEICHFSGTRSKIGGRFENLSGIAMVLDALNGFTGMSSGFLKEDGVGDEVG